MWHSRMTSTLGACGLVAMAAAAAVAAPAPNTPMVLLADGAGGLSLPPVGTRKAVTVDGTPREAVVRSFHRMSSTEGGFMSQLSFALQNLFNTTTEPVEMDPASLNLWSGQWLTSPVAPPCNGEFKPLDARSLNYGFAAGTNPLDPKNPNLINGSFVLRPKPCSGCGNYSQGFLAYAFAMIPVGDGGNEIIIETAGAITDDMYSEEFSSLIGPQMAVTLVLRHRNCDPEGWSKCKACTCPTTAATTPAL